MRLSLPAALMAAFLLSSPALAVPHSELLNSTVRVRLENSSGSGVFISPRRIITNQHVVTDNKTVTIDGWVDGKLVTLPATVIRVDESRDLAILEIKRNWRGRFAKIAKSAPRAGDHVYACGSPFGLQSFCTEGQVGLPLMDVPGLGGKRLMMSAPIAPGNSGGALFNEAGEIVGIAEAGLQTPSGPMSRQFWGHIAFALPVDMIRDFLRRRA